jgi:aminoglycoside phosphotransferase family enzyme/predicted kinase
MHRLYSQRMGGAVVGLLSRRTREDVNRGDAVLQDQKTLIRALRDPALYDHPVGDIRLIETHISWVILTGEFVYKIKKAVNFGFLDFSTLEKRHLYCREEVRLNRRFAPDLYLDVVAVKGDAEHPALHGEGLPIEYAVRMRQFPQQALLSSMASHRGVTPDHIDEIAGLVAAMHARAAVADVTARYGQPHEIHHWVMENFAHIRPVLKDSKRTEQLCHLEQWCQREFQVKKSVIQSRKTDGFIRECHGDLHLGNLALINGRITPFDCIEFNPHLRWIDVMSESAFLLMDLQDRGYPELACRFLNALLQRTGDYAGVRILRYYLVYRALVRAKVAVLRLDQTAMAANTEDAAWIEYGSYVELARNYASSLTPALIITHGVSGTGKSWYASRLAISLDAIQVRSDVERKRLFGYRMDAKTGSGVQSGIYTVEAGMETYARLADLARYLIEGGYTAIVDAAFLKRAERDRFRLLAKQLGVPFVLLHFSADEDTLRNRICLRQASSIDPSEAGVEVMEAQLSSQEPLVSDEQVHTVLVDASREPSVADIAIRVNEKTNPVRDV